MEAPERIAMRTASAALHEATVSYPDRLVIAPAWGHLSPEPLAIGQVVEEGAIIGTVQEGAREVPIVSPVRGLFVAWVVLEGERVAPRKPVAWLRLADA